MEPSWPYLGLSSRPKNLDFPMVFLAFYDICASSTILTRSCFIFRDLKPVFNDLKPFLGDLWAIKSQLGPSEANLKPSWGHLGAILGPSWGYIGPSSRQKAVNFLRFLQHLRVFNDLNTILSPPSTILTNPLPSWADLGRSLGDLGPSWADLGRS